MFYTGTVTFLVAAVDRAWLQKTDDLPTRCYPSKTPCMMTGKGPQDGWTVTETDERTLELERRAKERKRTMAMARMAEAQLQF